MKYIIERIINRNRIEIIAVFNNSTELDKWYEKMGEEQILVFSHTDEKNMYFSLEYQK